MVVGRFFWGSCLLSLAFAVKIDNDFLINPLNQGRKPSPNRPFTNVKPHEQLYDYSKPVPESWDWSNVNGTNYLTLLRNQHLPQYCGSCWAHAVTSALSDRIKIARNAAWPDINIAPQILVSCGPDSGCYGGDAGEANEWMAQNYVTDETCSIYRAKDKTNGVPCSSTEICETCWGFDQKCTQPPHFFKYKVKKYGPIFGDSPKEQEEAMKREIFENGPIACGIGVTKELVAYKSGVFTDQTHHQSVEHDISVVGYGVDEQTGEMFWKIRNSWGTYWGEEGFLRLRRGINNLQIESGECVWATPEDTWTNAEAERREKLKLKPVPSEEVTKNMPFIEKLFTLLATYSRNAYLKRTPKHRPCLIKKSDETIEHILTPQPKDYVSDDEVPENWDWRNVNGTNFLSWNINQHIPHYCGSCWAQGPVSALADRFIIADKQKYANLALAAQVVVNCQEGGTCEGGNPVGVYRGILADGVPHQTCQPYTAEDPKYYVKDCSKPDMEVCKDCTWPPPKPGQKPNCWAKKEFKLYKARQFGAVRGAMNMKKEIYKRGPIACGIDVTEGFVRYTSGIYSEVKANAEINHELSIVGFGKDKETGKEYWIGRNSWGTYWGEYGFFKIEMHKNNLAIETDCIWAEPETMHV